MRNISNIVILTGAGVSADSGTATFRGFDGLWEDHRVEPLRFAKSEPRRRVTQAHSWILGLW